MRMSETISALAPALVAAAAELTNPARTADNPFYKSKYTPLNGMIDHLRPVLAQHDLCAVQSAGDGVTTMILHKSGEWIETDPLHVTPAKNDPQGIGGAVTYARRYSLAAALGIASDDDDDANHASGNQQGGQRQSQPPQQQTPPGEVEPKKHTGDGFEMADLPTHKSGDHVFLRGPNAQRWNGKTWAELATIHGSIIKSGGTLANSPIADMLASKFMGGWNREHAAYLDMTIRASVQPPDQPSRSVPCPDCGKPTEDDGITCLECIPF